MVHDSMPLLEMNEQLYAEADLEFDESIDDESNLAKALDLLREKLKTASGEKATLHDMTEFFEHEVVRWDSLADWQAFIAAASAEPEAFRTIFAVMTLEATNVYAEVEHLPASAPRLGQPRQARARKKYVL